MPPISVKSPAVVHHMAALDDMAAPPNSLERIRASLEAGAAIIEVDINALAERDYLLVHEDDLSAETSGQGPVISCTVDTARSLMIKHHGTVTSSRAVLLSDVVQAFLDSKKPTILQLDFKNVIPLPSNEPLWRLIQLIEPLKGQVIVSSGADWQLRRLRKIAPWLILGFDVMLYIGWQPSNEPRDPREFPKKLGAYGYYDDHLLAIERYWPTAQYLQDRCETFVALVPDVSVFYLEHNLIAQSLRDGFNWAHGLHEHGIKLDAWTMDVNNPVAVENLRVLQQAGVDYFTSNTPYALEGLLRKT